jgi:3-oxo-5-alpha-steroid 4-dehydrogenase 1
VKETTIFNGLLIGWFVLGVAVFVALFFIAAPYGRHSRKGWGYTVGEKLGWVIMEAPSPIVFAICFFTGSNALTTAPLAFLFMWQVHYLHRAFVYPLGLRGNTHRMPVSVISFGIFFNVTNAYLNGRYISALSGGYTAAWLTDPRFVIGTFLFVVGFAINRYADHILRGLRKPDENGYRIPHGRLYSWVSCPNYLGEITIWIGWAIATWSLPGLVFAFWTVANLLPRAKANHAWYRDTFEDYPPQRKALLPGLW